MNEYFGNGYENIEPLFLKVSFHRPHSPYDPPEKYINITYNNAIENGNYGILTNITHGNTWDERYTAEYWNNTQCTSASKDAWCGWFDKNTTDIF